MNFQAAWITGAGTGIGRVLALELASGGTRVAVSARSADSLAALADHADNIMLVPLDVTDRNAVAQAVDTVEAAFGELDLCVPNAGISQASSATAPDVNAFGNYSTLMSRA